MGQAQAAGLRPALARSESQLARVPPGAALARHAAGGIRLICPGEPCWPPQLDDLGTARPYALSVRGAADLRASCEKSLAVVGARAATAYGRHAATCIAADLAGRGWAIVSGGAYGIDAAAHHGALAADRATVAVLACGPDVPYPRAHAGLLADIAERGTVVSECPPGHQPSRFRFLARNRIIALADGTVLIEAAERSGTLATARHASNLARPLMAVPGPITSATSASGNALIRDQRAAYVTSAADAAKAAALS
jgi:DNA processing protein